MAQRDKPYNQIPRLLIEQAAAIRNGEIRYGLRSILYTYFEKGVVILRFGQETEDFMYYSTIETGKRIKQLRKTEGLTQEQLAEKVGVSARMV